MDKTFKVILGYTFYQVQNVRKVKIFTASAHLANWVSKLLCPSVVCLCHRKNTIPGGLETSSKRAYC